MTRLLLFTGLLVSAAHGAPGGVVAEEPGFEAMCRGAEGARVELDASEFEVSGYDSGRGVLTLRLAPVLVRARGQVLVDARGPVPLAMGANDLETALEARKRGSLRLELDVHCVQRSPFGPRLDQCCGSIRPDIARLSAGQLLVAERNLREPFAPRPRIDAHVQVATVRAFDEKGVTEALVGDEVRRRAHMHGHSCLLRALHASGSVNGAVSVEIRVRRDRRPRRPRIVVDGLVHDALEHCLVSSLFEDAALWEMLPAPGRVYVPFYFRGDAVFPAMPAADNGANPP